MKTYLIAISCFVAVSVWAAEPTGLDTLRSTYQGQLAKIADEEMAAIATAQDQYIAALTSLEKQFQAAGKLDPLLKAQEEKKRFSSDRSVEAKDIVLGVPEISGLQNRYITAVKSVPLDPAKKRLTLAGFYERSLKKLEEDLTKGNDIQGALAVKEERESLAERAEIVLAQKTVARLSVPAPVGELKQHEVVEDVPVVEEVKGPASLSNMEKGKIQAAVKNRFNDFVDDISDQDWENALEFVDPEYVRKNGSNVAKSVLKMKFGMARVVADNPGSKIRCKEIEVSDTGDQVGLTPELWARNRAHSLQKMTWIPRDEEWYLSLGNPSEERQGADSDRRQLPHKKKRRW